VAKGFRDRKLASQKCYYQKKKFCLSSWKRKKYFTSYQV
jgi:hypothetical protein